MIFKLGLLSSFNLYIKNLFRFLLCFVWNNKFLRITDISRSSRSRFVFHILL
uniref:Uncharacterized protein n=1 Tax=Octopus bimaculoides TaxID=37653 RepID=A0A0L8FV06_OCTBM